MGSKGSRRSLIIIALLLVAAYMVYGLGPTPLPRGDELSLQSQIVTFLKNYGEIEAVPLGKKIVEALELDDFLNYLITVKDESLLLYVGYYNSQKKVGAAHSPLVCFPGQGWNMSDMDSTTINLEGETINLAQMVIAKGEDKYFVYYWFQAYNNTSPGTFMQKVNLLRSKLLHASERNAFVRVMVPFGHGRSEQEALEIADEFVRFFYPVFKNYMVSGQPDEYL